MYYSDNKLRVFKMLKKLMEAEEKKDAAAAEETPPTEEAPAETPAEVPAEETPPTEEAPAETPAEVPAEETPLEEAPEETPPAEAPEEAATEETPAEATTEETAEEPKADPAQEAAKKIEDMAKKNIVDDYDLAKQLKFSYQPILNANTLREKTGAIRTYQKIIDDLIKSSENKKIRDALEKTRDFIRADSKVLATRFFRKLKK
jgi:outer membrane biosynthesis protein TonB